MGSGLYRRSWISLPTPFISAQWLFELPVYFIVLIYNKKEYNLMMADIEAETCSYWQLYKPPIVNISVSCVWLYLVTSHFETQSSCRNRVRAARDTTVLLACRCHGWTLPLCLSTVSVCQSFSWLFSLYSLLAVLRKATVSLIMSVIPSVGLEQLGFHLRDLQEILYLNIFFENLSRKCKLH